MRVLVGYATQHGSTGGVAERIAARLRERGLSVDVVIVNPGQDAASYDAVVLGSAVYSATWLADATGFASRNAATLARRPVWTFSVGWLRDQRGVLRNVTWPDAREPDRVSGDVRPRDHHFFAGAIDGARLTRSERLAFRALGGRYGDFRDWDEIDAWADGIAAALQAASGDSADGGDVNEATAPNGASRQGHPAPRHRPVPMRPGRH